MGTVRRRIGPVKTYKIFLYIATSYRLCGLQIVFFTVGGKPLETRNWNGNLDRHGTTTITATSKNKGYRNAKKLLEINLKKKLKLLRYDKNKNSIEYTTCEGLSTFYIKITLKRPNSIHYGQV